MMNLRKSLMSLLGEEGREGNTQPTQTIKLDKALENESLRQELREQIQQKQALEAKVMELTEEVNRLRPTAPASVAAPAVTTTSDAVVASAVNIEATPANTSTSDTVPALELQPSSLSRSNPTFSALTGNVWYLNTKNQAVHQSEVDSMIELTGEMPEVRIVEAFKCFDVDGNEFTIHADRRALNNDLKFFFSPLSMVVGTSEYKTLKKFYEDKFFIEIKKVTAVTKIQIQSQEEVLL